MTTLGHSPDGNCRLFRRRFSTSDDESAEDDQPISDMDVGLIAVGISWVPSEQSPTASTIGTFGQEWEHGTIVVKRVMVWGVPNASHQRLPLSVAMDEECEVSWATDRLVDAFDDYAAKRLVGPAWKRSSEVWVTPVCKNVEAVTERIEGFHDQWHELVLGKSVQYLGGSTFLSDIATELPLPGDTLFSGVRRILEISGILFGLATGQPLLVNACFKLWTHDVIFKTVSKGIGDLLVNALGLEPIGACERDFERADPRGKVAKQTTSVRGDFGFRAKSDNARDRLEEENLSTDFGFGTGREKDGDRSVQDSDRSDPSDTTDYDERDYGR